MIGKLAGRLEHHLAQLCDPHNCVTPEHAETRALIEEARMSDRPTSERWKRPNSCEGGACVEVLPRKGLVLLRVSADVNTILCITNYEWDAFVNAVKAGEYDK